MTDTNRELDARVAVARGWTEIRNSTKRPPVLMGYRPLKRPNASHSWGARVPRYSTDWAAAGTLIDEMAAAPLQGFILKLDWHCPEVAGSGYAWASWEMFDPKCGAYGHTPQEAICKAYLKWKARE